MRFLCVVQFVRCLFFVDVLCPCGLLCFPFFARHLSYYVRKSYVFFSSGVIRPFGLCFCLYLLGVSLFSLVGRAAFGVCMSGVTSPAKVELSFEVKLPPDPIGRAYRARYIQGLYPIVKD